MFGLERAEAARKCYGRFDGFVLGISEDIYTSPFNTQSSHQSSQLRYSQNTDLADTCLSAVKSPKSYIT